MIVVRSRWVLAIAIGTLAFMYESGAGFAAGFGLREGATDWMANAFAGETAKAYDASTAYTNPAGMVRLDQTELDGSLNGIFPTVNFSGINMLNGAPVAGTTAGNDIQSAADPAQFGVYNFSPYVKFGFSMTGPFGQRTTYANDFVGRYQALVSSVTDVAASASAAYRIDDHFSIGAGPVLNWFYARLTQALNLAPLGDGAVDVHGQKISAGFNIGGLYQFDPSTRIGIDYRSRINHDVTVTQAISPPATNPAIAAAIAAQSTTGKVNLVLPDSLTVGFYHQIDQQWAVMSDVQWTHWSLLQNVTIRTRNGAPPTVIPENWRDTAFVSIGASYQATDKLLLQAGLYYDESPVTDANRTSRLPDNNRYGTGFGLTYAALGNVDLQVAYLHVFYPTGTIKETTSPTSGTLVGRYSLSANAASIGIRVRF
jgi:long-chain fatty acid transport protein